MTDEEIARTNGLQWNEADVEKEYQKEQIRGTNARVLRAIAQARKEGAEEYKGSEEHMEYGEQCWMCGRIDAIAQAKRETAQRCAEKLRECQYLRGIRSADYVAAWLELEMSTWLAPDQGGVDK